MTADMESVPIFLNFKPANAREAAYDHDYLEHFPEYNFLKGHMYVSVDNLPAGRVSETASNSVIL